MNTIDFGQSFLRFTSTRVNHTPRLLVDAACTITLPNSSPRQYFLTVPCIGEAMYEERNLIHHPPAEFRFICDGPGDGAEYLILKRAVSSSNNVRSLHAVGEAMPTATGVPSTVIGMSTTIRHYTNVSPIETYADFRQALLGDLPINGRTTYRTDDGAKVVLDYPAKTVNVGHGREVWQVDAGPILMPSEPPVGDRLISRFNIAYLVYNAQTWADAGIHQPTPLDPNDPAGPTTDHYSRHVRLNCTNELFAASLE